MAQADYRISNTAVDAGWAVRNGLIGGFIAGIVFAAAEMVAAWVTMGKPTAPLHMIAGIPLQQDPMKIDDGTAIPVGLIAHMLYSMVVGVIVGLIVVWVPALRNSPTATVIFTALLGLLAWPLNFYVIAPLINAPWFAAVTNPSDQIQQAIWHTLFGAALGLYLAARLPRVVSASAGVRPA
jgi:uncharacterized membrane protein YagU involved in acid resistance